MAFAYFWFMLYKRGRRDYAIVRDTRTYLAMLFCLLYFAIESTADASLIGNRGVTVAMLLALSLNKLRQEASYKLMTEQESHASR